MAKNILATLDGLTVEMLDSGVGVVSGVSKKLHDEFTVHVFERLVDYVRSCTWSDNDTTKFVARNFMVSQSDMPNLWSEMYPDKPLKADSTFRVQYQNINRYLSNVLPSNLLDIFINDERQPLEELNLTIDSLILNDKRVESELGSQLCYSLSSLPLTGKKYELSDCMTELTVMNKLSIGNNMKVLETCDESKLAYVYWVLTRPSVINGNVNTTRLDFIKEMLSCNEDVSYSKQTEITVADECSMYGTLKYIHDILGVRSNSDVLELCETTLTQYKHMKEHTLYFTLSRVKSLLETGNEVSAIKTLLGNALLKGVSVTPSKADEPSTPVTKTKSDETNIPVTQDFEQLLTALSNSIRSNEDVDKILAVLRQICSDKGLTYDLFNSGGMKFIKQYAEGAEIDPDSIANTDIINFIHLHCTKKGIETGLQQFSPSDVAYIVNEMEHGNRDYIESVKNGINIESLNYIGDYAMCAEAKHEIEQLIADIEPSDEPNGVASVTMKDYTIDGMKKRLSEIPVADLARVYDEMLSSNETI